MAEFVLEEAKATNTDKEFTPIPDGLVAEAEVMAIVVKPKMIRGEEMERVEFAFKIVDGEFRNRRVWGDTSTAFVDHPECKLRAWTQEIMGVDLPKGFKLDTDALVGSRCRVRVDAYEYEPRNAPGTKKWGARVSDVIRSKSQLGLSEEPF
jgi:hypothetical protein